MAATTIHIEFCYDFIDKEIVIRFETPQQASAYRSRNTQGRIRHDRSSCDVWLPVEPAMKYLRNSSTGMVIVFESKETADDWATRTLLGRGTIANLNNTATYGVTLDRDIDPEGLKKLIGDFGTFLSAPPISGRPPYVRSFAGSDRYKFDVERSRASRE